MERDGLLNDNAHSSAQVRPANQADSLNQGLSSRRLYPDTQGLQGDPSASQAEPKVSFTPNEPTSSVSVHYSSSGRQIKVQYIYLSF